MRILFAIPHYFYPTAAGQYGSERSTPQARALATRQCLTSLRQHFAGSQGLMDGRRSRLHPANAELAAAAITIALCTTGDSHLVADLAGCEFDHVATNVQSRLLGFECHKVLRDGLGQYDYFAYLEDDLRITDALFFVKLAWFTSQFGDGAVLQPNRFELSAEPVYKLYIDGNPHDPQSGAGLQRIDAQRRMAAAAFGRQIAFQRIENPHSGCFFLNAAQFARWASEPDFAVPSAGFCGPLESAATLGIMRHFRIYKPARENAAFLEIEHLDLRYLGKRLRISAGDPTRFVWE